MGDTLFCNLCLATDVKLCEMSPNLQITYYELVSAEGLHLISELYACYECAYLLCKYERFKQKCCKAYNILKCLTLNGSQITKDTLKTIDRKKNSLDSRLSTDCHNIKVVESYHKPGSKTVNAKEIIENVAGFQNVLITEDLELSNEQIKEEPLGDDALELDIKTETLIESEPDAYKDSNDNSNLVKSDIEDFNTTSFTEDDHDLNEDLQSETENDSDSDDNANESNNDCDTDNLNEILSRYPMIKDNSDEKIIIKLQKRKPQNRDKEIQPKRRKLSKQKIKDIDDIFKNYEQTDTSQGVTKKGSEDSLLFDKYATIVELDHKQAREEVVLRKESRNYKMNKFKCELCFRGFGLKNTFESHMKKHSEAEGPFECDACHFRFGTKSHVKNHIANTHMTKYMCLLCPKVVFGRQLAKHHVLQHKGKRYECKICGEKYRFPNSVFSHHRMKHKLEVVCDLCGNAFAVERGLISHKRLVHKGEKNEYQGPKCEECNIHFTNHTAYKRHFVLSSKHAIIHGCHECGESFPNKKSFREHKRSHENSIRERYKQRFNPHRLLLGPCVYCGVPLNATKVYSSHMLKEHPDSESAKQIRKQLKFVCDICGKMFRAEYYLTLHQRVHSGERPFSCNVCARTFTCLQTMSAHHRSRHLDVLPYKCHVCDKRFGHKPNMVKHMKCHSSEKPFKCTICDKRFHYQYQVKMHKNYVHDKMPWPKRDRSKRNVKTKD